MMSGMSGDLSAFLPTSFGAKKRTTKKVNRNGGKKVEEKGEGLSAFLPTSFGKKRKLPSSTHSHTISPKKTKYEEEEKMMLPPILPTEENEEGEEEEEEEKEKSNSNPLPKEVYPLPVSDMVEMKGHSGSVLSIDIDPSGSRMITGGTDFNVKFWDFAGMMSNYQSFRELEVEEGHPVVDVAWNGTGAMFLASTSGLRPRLYDRDGKLISEFMKGDPYILDMQHTKGHVSATNSLTWDCDDPTRFMTASSDSTVRIWDCNRSDKQVEVIKAKNVKNTRVPISTMASSPWDSTRNIIAAGCTDGSIQIWAAKGPYRKPSILIRNGHQHGTETSSICISRDGNLLVSRGGDDSLKFWDLRKPQKPLHELLQVENAFQQTGCCFSPDEKIIVTGTSVRPGYGKGKLLFFDVGGGSVEQVHSIDVCDHSVISVLWHPKLNQIMAGCGDRVIRTYFSPTVSRAGVLMGFAKDPRRKKVQGFVSDQESFYIHNPNALLKPQPSTARQKLKNRRDPIKSRKPDLPVITGAKGHGGHLGKAPTQLILASMHKRAPAEEKKK